jgi:hypothetical protein
LLFIPLTALSQEAPGAPYSRLNTFSSLVEYSNDSSHIILGTAENRKIGAIGFQYQRRLVNRRLWNFSYTAEIRPTMLESDPVLTETITSSQTYSSTTSETQNGAVMRCTALTVQFSGSTPGPSGPEPYSGEVIDTCSRRTVVAQGFSPAGMRFNLMPRHRLQPTFSSYAGYMFATQEVPIPETGSFNFTFEFGGGLEFFRTHNRSMRLEYQVQHYSNKETAYSNPGVDSGFIKLTYAFGR